MKWVLARDLVVSASLTASGWLQTLMNVAWAVWAGKAVWGGLGRTHNKRSVLRYSPPTAPIISIHPLTPMDQIPVVSQFRGHITAPLPADSPLAYKEDAIVNLMIQILTMLISIGHIKAERILFAPPGGHTDIDEAVCAELNLGPRVVSLLKRLPYWTSSEFVEWAQIRPDSYLPNYRDPEHLRLGRRVCGLEIGINPDAGLVNTQLQPGEVILLFEREEGETWILDTEASECFPPSNCPG